MRIVGRKEFLALPAGTLFCQCVNRWSFYDLCIKGDTWLHGPDGDGDFLCMPFTSIDSDSSEQELDRFEEMEVKRTSYPIDLETYGRDGLFERNALFLVFEREDVLKLRDLLSSVL